MMLSFLLIFLQSLQPVCSLQVCLCVCACVQSKVTTISLVFVDFILLFTAKRYNYRLLNIHPEDALRPPDRQKLETK